MPEYLAPGVFVEEVELKAPSIEGVSTSTTGMVGHAVRGPKEGRPVLVTNMLQFRQRFGGPLPATETWKGELFYAAQGFFANGGRRLYVMRAAAAGAKAAEFAAKGGLVTRLAPGADVPIDGATKSIRPATTLGMTDGNLSVHARKLEDAGYIACTRGMDGRIPRTEYRLTPAGRAALNQYLTRMEALIKAMRFE